MCVENKFNVRTKDLNNVLDADKRLSLKIFEFFFYYELFVPIRFSTQSYIETDSFLLSKITNKLKHRAQKVKKNPVIHTYKIYLKDFISLLLVFLKEFGP